MTWEIPVSFTPKLRQVLNITGDDTHLFEIDQITYKLPEGKCYLLNSILSQDIDRTLQEYLKIGYKLVPSPNTAFNTNYKLLN